ncbi:MAG: DUF2189 domain-containing protein [Xanthobacteraceae bacterium]
MSNLHIMTGASDTPAYPTIRQIDFADLRDAFTKGVDDFLAAPTQLIFLAIIYPIVGLFLARLIFGYQVLPLLFPLVAGYALVGPFAALGLYEMSRRREQGQEVTWKDALGVFQCPSLDAIGALGFVLMVVFVIWLAVALGLYDLVYGPETPQSFSQFISEILTTTKGWVLIIVGHVAGFIFAVVALTVGVVSFPLLLDRDVGAVVALQTSVRAVLANPLPMAAWGFFVAVLLALGSIPFFIGLAIVIPVLAHATWHLYRKLVEPAGAPISAPAG